MANDDADIIDLTNDGDNNDDYDPRELLEPVVTRIIDALGGVEGGIYRMGEQAGACLKDLKKLWRRDDTDDDRTIARIFWERRLLQNDLVPILLATAGKGVGEDKRAIACVDLMTAMTWPIDMAEELKELDEEEDKGADFTHLLESHLHYKAALVTPGVMDALFNIICPPLSKSLRERTERDSQLVTVVLYLIRNLAFVKDHQLGANISSHQFGLTSLQSKLIKELSGSNFIEFIITIAANTEKDPWLEGWNTVTLEILYLLFRGVNPTSLTGEQTNQPREKLKHLLATEARLRREAFSNPATRHSRFGTTIAVTLNPNKKRSPADPQPRLSKEYLLHRQQALNKEAVDVMDISKRQRSRKGNTVDELSRQDNLSVEARVILQEFAQEFLRACFNPFVSALLKEIRLERAKVTEKDKLRLLFVSNFFLECFLALRAKEQPSQSDKDQSKEEKWPLGLIAEVVERDWIVWVLKRMREAVDEKPKLWAELQAGIKCLTQLLLLIDNMSGSEIEDATLAESAELLQQQIIYNGDVLDIALDSLRAYREGSQSLAYLNASVHLAYALMRLLERWTKGKGDGVYVRKKTAGRKRKARGVTEEEGVPDAEEEERDVHEDVIQETLFTFDAFEMKFANAEINHTLLTYLARYQEFESPESMRRVVSLLHRQAIKAKAEGLFFNVSTLDLFKLILTEKDSLPRDQPYKDLIKLINFILRKFFKALAEDTFLAVEAFFPKNRGHWKQYSSWEPEDPSKRDKATAEDTRFPPEVQVKKGYSWSDQLGIAIAVLVEAGQTDLVNWTKDILTTVRDQRRRLIKETDKNSDQSQDEASDVDTTLRQDRPSAEALKKIKDYSIPYLNNGHAQAATKNEHLKLLFRLCKFAITDKDEDELQWYIPAAILPSDLQGTLNVINQLIETPFDLAGKKASDLLSKKRPRRRRRRRASSPESGDDKPRKEKKKKEKEQYKSAQFIQDSDEEFGDMDAFLEKERLLRDRVGLARTGTALQADRPLGMRPHGTKKRRGKAKNTASVSEPEGLERSVDMSRSPSPSSGDSESSSEEGTEEDVAVVPSSPRAAPPRPRPRPLRKNNAETADEGRVSALRSPSPDKVLPNAEQPSETQSRARRLVVLSDDDE